MIEDATNRLVTTARREQFEPLTHVAAELGAPSIKSRHRDVTTGYPDASKDTAKIYELWISVSKGKQLLCLAWQDRFYLYTGS